MSIKPRIKEFICLTSDSEGCKRNVKEQIAYIEQLGKTEGPKNVLIIGASSGYGLSTRITTTYACNSATIGVMFEKPEFRERMATSGWYNTKAFEDRARADGYYAETINGDAFSKDIKKKTVELIKKDLKSIDMVIYSLASPKRKLEDGTIYKSSLKTIGSKYESKNLVLKDNTVTDVIIEAASSEEIDATIKVMGGEDWKEWIDTLMSEGVLSENAVTIAYSYMGPELTYPIYHKGTIGAAKQHLYEVSAQLNKENKASGLRAYISMNKALVTQASSAIPIVPLYISILYKVMKDKNIHEGCIEQMGRLFFSKLKSPEKLINDNHVIHLDDWELREDVQKEIKAVWEQIDTENLEELADLDGYWYDFYKIYGFKYMDYKSE